MGKFRDCLCQLCFNYRRFLLVILIIIRNRVARVPRCGFSYSKSTREADRFLCLRHWLSNSNKWVIK